MGDRPSFYSPFQAFFDRTLIDTSYIYVDLWSFVHLTSGVLLGVILIRYLRPVYALAWAIALILGYEVAELALNDVLFVPETPVDTIWDAIIGFLGAFVALRIAGRKKIAKTAVSQPESGSNSTRGS